MNPAPNQEQEHKPKSPFSLSAPDAVLVRAAGDGDLAAFETLVARYEKKVYRLARAVTGTVQDAEDVTQQTFLNAMRALPKFRGYSSFATWLMRIAAHAALKVLRKRKGLATVSLDAQEDPGDNESFPPPRAIADWRDTPDRLALQAETREILESALSNLPPRHRAVFLLRDVEGFSVRETARSLGISQGNVKVMLLRARLRLRDDLTRAFGPSRRGSQETQRVNTGRAATKGKSMR